MARRAATLEQAQVLAADDSPYAIMPGNPEGLKRLVVEMGQVREDGIPPNTRRADETAFNAVRRHCESEVDTPVMRPRIGTVFSELREEVFYAMLCVGLAMAIKPGKHTAAKGMTHGKGSTALNYIYGFIRVMKDCGRYVPLTMNGVLKQLKGLNARTRAAFGQDALIPRRTQPFSQPMLHKMVAALRGGLVGGWTACMHAVMLAMVCYGVSTGTRCDEMTRSRSEPSHSRTDCESWTVGDSDFLRRSNFTPWVQGAELEATPESWARLDNGDMICGHSAPSKCDRDNVTFGPTKQWFRVNKTNPLNFAAAYAAYEVAYPCPLEQRSSWPAFSPTGDRSAFTGRELRTLLSVLMVLTIGAAEAALRSWHAFRVTIACALMARPEYKSNPGAQTALIQMMVRWKTPESVKVYAHMLPGDYADHVDDVTITDGHPMADMAHSVTIDPTDGYADVELAIAELEVAVAAAKKQKRREVAPTPEAEAAIIAPAPATAAAAPARAAKAAGATRRKTAAPMASTLPSFDCGEDGMVSADTSDSLVGAVLNIPDRYWDPKLPPGNTTPCTVVGYAAQHKAAAAKKRGAYVVVTNDDHYAFDASLRIFKRISRAKK